MKAIQITVDEGLLRRLDADAETRKLGRSAVFRRALEDYLKRRRAAAIRSGYKSAYGGKGAAALDPAFDGWTDEGVWPEP